MALYWRNIISINNGCVEIIHHSRSCIHYMSFANDDDENTLKPALQHELYDEKGKYLTLHLSNSVDHLKEIGRHELQ